MDFFIFIKLLISQDAGKLHTLDEQLFFHSEANVEGCTRPMRTHVAFIFRGYFAHVFRA